MIVRIATPQDVPQLVELRMRLFAEVGGIEHPGAALELRAATTQYFAQTSQTAKSWVATAEGSVVALRIMRQQDQRPHRPGQRQ